MSASPGDAVTDTALAFRELLRRLGPSDVFARYVAPELDHNVLRLAAYEAQPEAPDDLLIYHASIGDPSVAGFLAERRARIVVVYHNITPAEYFVGYDTAFAELLALGRRELAGLRDRVTLALAVSEYNAAELRAMGFRDVRTSPLPVDLGRLASLEPDAKLAAELAQLDGPLVLFVGQILPHKRPDLLIKAHHVLTTYLAPEANLALVGPARLERYRQALQTMVSELHFPYGAIPGWLSPEQLAAFYRRADVFVTMSEHEGFCVPVLEAMTFDVPVVARERAALPDTVAGAGLLVPPEEDPLLAAEAVFAVLSEPGLRAELVARGRRRVADFPLEKAQATFLTHLASVA